MKKRPACEVYRPHFDFLCLLKCSGQIASNYRKMCVLSLIMLVKMCETGLEKFIKMCYTMVEKAEEVIL